MSEFYRYILPSIRGEGWADIVCTRDGFFACVSDYGNYVHAWRNFGDQDFRLFLVDLADSPEYVASKLWPKKVYDGQATLKAIYTSVLGSRRRGLLTKIEADAEWTLANRFAVDIQCGTDGVAEWAGKSLLGMNFVQDGLSYMYSPQVMSLCTKTWPRLVELIVHELQTESVVGV